MRIAVLGAGQMGMAVALDLCKSGAVEEVLVADVDPGRLKAVTSSLGSPKATSTRLDVEDSDGVIRTLRSSDIAVSCVPYRFNHELAKAAVEAGCDFCDLGGNFDIVSQELELDGAARAAGVTIVPDCGLAPGLTNVLAADALERFDRLEELHIRVGGLPVTPRPPLGYQLVFSPAGLVNEYRERCQVIREGRVQLEEPLEDVEEIEFPEPFGRLEAFNTSGGTSTLPRTLLGRVNALDYKTIRYPGHCERVRLLRDLGLFDDAPVLVEGREIAPRALTEALLSERLAFGEDDVVLVRVWATGLKDGAERTLTYSLVDHCDRENGITAMMRTTAYPASIVAQMMASGEVSARGAVPPELAIPAGRFLEELGKRGLDIQTNWG